MPHWKVPATTVDVDVVERAIEAEVLKRLESPLRNAIKHAVNHSLGRAAPAASTGSAPKPGGKCAAVWSELDNLYQRYPDQIPKIGDIMKKSQTAGWNDNNTRIEYYNWRRSKGIRGRV